MHRANPTLARRIRETKNYHKVQRSDKRTKSQRGEGKTALRNIMVCEAKHQENKQTCAKRGRELKREALHKTEVCEAKHTYVTNKTCARERGAEEKSTTQTRCFNCEEKHIQITNKACAREKGAKKKALQKPGAFGAKHTDMINKRCAKGTRTEQNSQIGLSET